MPDLDRKTSEGSDDSSEAGETVQQVGTSIKEISGEPEPSLLQEFLQFIREEKQWWLIPIMLVLGTLGLLAMLAQTGAAPFIYTLF